MPPWHIGQVAVHNPFIPYAYVGFNGYEFGGLNVTRTSLDIPTSAREGDLMVVALNGRMQASTTDPRLTPVGATGYGEGAGGWAGGVWVGYVGPKTVPILDGSGNPTGAYGHQPLAVMVQSAGNAFSQFAALSVACYRGVEIGGVVRNPIQYHPDRLVQGVQHGGMPAVPGKGSGAIGVMLTHGGIGGGYGTSSWKPPYSGGPSTGGSYSLCYYGSTDAPIVPATPPVQNDSGDSYRHWAIGLR